MRRGPLSASLCPCWGGARRPCSSGDSWVCTPGSGGGGSLLTRTGLLVGLVGTVLGVFHGLNWWEGLDWWIVLFAGLTVVSVGMIVEEASRLLGTLVLASGTLGWVSLLSDPAFSGVLVPMRQVHVAFAALFCLSCVAWGWVLFHAVSKRT
jgi:hypothetical protein